MLEQNDWFYWKKRGVTSCRIELNEGVIVGVGVGVVESVPASEIA